MHVSSRIRSERNDTADDIRQVAVLAPNFKRRLSGVTSTVIQLVPKMRDMGFPVAAIGEGLPSSVMRVGYSQLLRCWRRPAGRRFRVWHARRNVEMVWGLILRDVLRMPFKVMFTSAAQRHHRPFTKWLIRRMDAVVATSAVSGSFLDVPHTVIMHGIDVQAFRPARGLEDSFRLTGLPGSRAIGCFGRIRHQKGTDLFVDAMIELLPRYPEWTAVVTGRVTVEQRAFAEALREKVRAAHLEDRIHFLGEVDDIKAWYRRIDLYVAPSRNEGFGLTPLEAMASGKPVVASDAGAFAEMIIDGETGAVVPADDGAALTAAIETYLADPALAKRHGEAALSHVRDHFRLEREAHALIAIYEKLAA